MRDYRRADRMLPARWGFLLGMICGPMWMLGALFHAVHVAAEWLTWQVDDSAATLRRLVLRWSGVTARMQAEDAERRERTLAELRGAIAACKAEGVA